MAFPTTIDSFPNPSASDFRIGHAALHTSVNTAIVALETLLGITGSTDVNSIIYKLTAAQTRLTALSNVDNTSDVNKPLSNAMQSALNNKVSSTIAVNGHQLTSSITVTQDDIGLGFVNNTSDITKWAAIATLTNKTFDNSTNTLVFGGNQSIGGFRLTNLGEPTASSDAATKSYVDNISFGINNKITVKLATITTLPAYTYNNGTAGV